MLQQLVAPPGQHVTGTVELLTLAPCRKLTCLEVLTSSRLYMPFSLKTVSLATLAWPRLAVLKLSLAGGQRWLCDHVCVLLGRDDNMLAGELLVLAEVIPKPRACAVQHTACS